MVGLFGGVDPMTSEEERQELRTCRRTLNFVEYLGLSPRLIKVFLPILVPVSFLRWPRFGG